MSERKKREITPTDSQTIIDNVKESPYSEADKEKLKLQALRINSEMVNQQIGIPELVEVSGISQGAIGQYKTGKVLIKEDLLQPICDALNVSKNYLRGLSDAKKYENEELNKMFGLSDESILNIKYLKNKDVLNYIFENDDIDIDYLLLETKNYINASKNLNEYKEKYKGMDLEYDKKYIDLLGKVQFASFNMSQTFIRLITRNIK